jgi:hypothetical protein
MSGASQQQRAEKAYESRSSNRYVSNVIPLLLTCDGLLLFRPTGQQAQ